MTQIVIEGELAERLQKLAAQEQIEVEMLLERLLFYQTQLPILTDEEKQAQQTARMAAVGIFKDDVTDMSTTVRETIQKRFEADRDDSP